jgi:hypothetical protein
MTDVQREDLKALSLHHTSLSNVGVFCTRSCKIQLFCLGGEALKHNVELESSNHIFINWPTAKLGDISIAWSLGATPYFVLAFGQYEALRVKLLFRKVLAGLPYANIPIISVQHYFYRCTAHFEDSLIITYQQMH